MWDLLSGIPKLFRVPGSHRRAVARALWTTPRVTRSLHNRGYSETVSWLDQRPRPSFDDQDSLQAAKTVDSAIKALPWGVTCLERSLVVSWIAGPESEIRRGVAIGDNSHDHRFHAWVEIEGVVLNDSPNVATEFAPLDGRAVDNPDPSAFD